MTDPTRSSHTWLVDLRHIAIKKCHRLTADSTIILFAASKNKHRKARLFAQQRAHVLVIKVSGNKTSRAIQQHIAHYLAHTDPHTITLVSRANKLTKRWQQWQTQLPHWSLQWANTLPKSHQPLPVAEPTVMPSNDTHDTVATPSLVDEAAPTVDHAVLLAAPAVEPTVVPSNDTLDTVTAPSLVDEVAPAADHAVLLAAQAVIKKNKPKKKQDLARLLAQVLHLSHPHAHDVIQQLATLGRLRIDVAENLTHH